MTFQCRPSTGHPRMKATCRHPTAPKPGASGTPRFLPHHAKTARGGDPRRDSCPTTRKPRVVGTPVIAPHHAKTARGGDPVASESLDADTASASVFQTYPLAKTTAPAICRGLSKSPFWLGAFPRNHQPDC